jgi:hypothetical protein
MYYFPRADGGDKIRSAFKKHKQWIKYVGNPNEPGLSQNEKATVQKQWDNPWNVARAGQGYGFDDTSAPSYVSQTLLRAEQRLGHKRQREGLFNGS